MTVYSPGEDTYLLLDYLRQLPVEGSMLEIGTGSGLIAVEMAKRGWDVTATDINPEAIEEAEERAEDEGVEIDFRESDLFEEVEGRFDVVVFNPPYLPGPEGVGDEEIWRGGESGIEVSERFLESVEDYLEEDREAYLVASSEAEAGKLVEKYDLERIETEKLWFETLYLLKFK
jgi:release factor glutamine methyltransferase